MIKLVFCFDGTSNAPMIVNISFPMSISNALKLHALLGGKLNPYKSTNTEMPNQHSFYYSGVGTRDHCSS